MKSVKKYNVIKFQSPFEKLKEYDFNSETKLYKSVIIQAIIDVSNKADDLMLKQDELEAKNWLFGDSHDFLNICKFAELEPDNVITMARTAITLNKSLQFYFGKSKKIGKNPLRKLASKRYLLWGHYVS